MSADELRQRLDPLVGTAAAQLRSARQTWEERSADDLRVRLGGALVGGLLLGKVVKRVGR